jgi:hypothetical protein
MASAARATAAPPLMQRVTTGATEFAVLLRQLRDAAPALGPRTEVESALKDVRELIEYLVVP